MRADQSARELDTAAHARRQLEQRCRDIDAERQNAMAELDALRRSFKELVQNQFWFSTSVSCLSFAELIGSFAGESKHRADGTCAFLISCCISLATPSRCHCRIVARAAAEIRL
jgi:hypothetical protein